jgi:hypothetical protein
MTQKASSANPNPEPPYILALDAGTSSTRALLFDAKGNTLPNVLAQRTYKLTISNEGEVSVDPDALVAIVEQTIDDVLEMAGPLAKHIGAVAIDTFWHGLMGVDADNRPLTPLILWEDTRSHGAAVELRNQFDETAIHARTGARLHASYWPAKLRWLATQAPDTFSRVSQWLSFGEYLYRHFLGRSVCSLSMASGTGMLHTRARAWDTELMEVLDVRSEQLPPLGDMHESVQGLIPAYASAWSALRNVPWFPAAGDGAAACVGSGKHQQEIDAETSPLRNPEYYQYDLNLPDVAELWRRGSVIGSWLLDLTADALLKSPDLTNFHGRVSDSGEGRWTLTAAIDESVPVPVLSSALFERFSSRDEADYADRLMSAMRFEFGGHLEKAEQTGGNAS